MNNKCKKAINFDLSEDLLQLHYPKSIKYAWREVGKYLKDNGFKHRQYSGYVSKQEIEDSQLMAIISNMWKQLPWLEYCAEKFDVTNIGKTYDLLAIRKASKSPTRKENVYNFKKGRVNDGSAFSNTKNYSNINEPTPTQEHRTFKIR